MKTVLTYKDCEDIARIVLASNKVTIVAVTVVLVVLRMIHGHLFPAILQRIAGQSRQSRTRLSPPSIIFSRPG